ncbi:MAG: hypothetical protein AB8C40_11070 [Gammaproteobacteria bacterium]
MRIIAMTLTLMIVGCMSLAGADESETRFAWKELRMACKGNHDSVECQEFRKQAREYCQAHPNKKRCKKLFAMKACRKNPDSEKCQEFKERFKVHCDKHPESKKCIRARLHQVCKSDPESKECSDAKEKAHAHFCEKHPDHDKCI